ncbi:hypothetical protein BC628DRAFT_1090516 [Trametes gibbosa]|nr:hypothetical protein BC628DRAFT_1090516 [Trametes gibbosa]
MQLWVPPPRRAYAPSTIAPGRHPNVPSTGKAPLSFAGRKPTIRGYFGSSPASWDIT